MSNYFDMEFATSNGDTFGPSLSNDILMSVGATQSIFIGQSNASYTQFGSKNLQMSMLQSKSR